MEPTTSLSTELTKSTNSIANDIPNRTIDSHILLAEHCFFEQQKLNKAEVIDALSLLDQHQIDYGDIYFQSVHSESLLLDDGIIKNGSFNIDLGVGIRAVSGEKTGFAYSDLLNSHTLQQSVIAARGICQQLRSSEQLFGINNNRKQNSLEAKVFYPALNPFETLNKKDKIALLMALNSYVRNQAPFVKELSISLNAVYEQVLIIATDGTYAADIRPLVRMSISVVAEKDGRRERANSGGGARADYNYFLESVHDKQRAFDYADEAIRLVQIALIAQDAPAGTMPVVLGCGWPGILLHEALGHGLEGDFNRKETSLFSGKVGTQVCSPLCTVVDDGTLINRRGSVTIDDEGTPGQYNTLIENGILKGYMQDKLNARLMGVAPTGNGRRESYACLPMPRMTNTYMLAGQSTPEQIISSVERGLYAPQFAGGQVDITSGQFVFTTSEAYLIENGKITHPVKGATLIGSGIDAMTNVSMVGNDLALDLGVGICGKGGQSVPVGVGQPTIKVDALTIGGTQ